MRLGVARCVLCIGTGCSRRNFVAVRKGVNGHGEPLNHAEGVDPLPARMTGAMCEPATILEVFVGQRVGRGHRTRQGHLHRSGCVAHYETHGWRDGERSSPQRTDHPRGIDRIAVAPAARGEAGKLIEVDAIEALHEAPNVMPAALLAIGEDVEAGFFLVN